MDVSLQIQSEIDGLNKELEVLSILNLKRQGSDLDDIEIRAASLSLSALYNGIEKILLDVLKEEGQFIKNEESWHTLLLKLSVDTEIISEKTFDELKGFLGFRHFIRHAYIFEINPLTINSILDNAYSLVELFIREVTNYYRNKPNPD
jgi:hypothetical protein